MSVRKMAEVWELPLPPTEKLVLLAYADHANDEGLCYPGAARIANKCSLSLRSAKRVGAWLRDNGYLELVVAGGGTQRTVVRVIANPKILGTSVAHDTGAKTGTEIPPTSVTARQPPVSPAVCITIREPSLNPTTKGAKPRDLLFDKLVDACGLNLAKMTKNERGKLNKAVGMLREVDATPEQITDNAKAYAKKFGSECELTPLGLANNWAQCSATPAAPSKKTAAQLADDKNTQELEYARNAQRTYKLRPQMRGEDPDVFVARVNREVLDARQAAANAATGSLPQQRATT